MPSMRETSNYSLSSLRSSRSYRSVESRYRARPPDLPPTHHSPTLASPQRTFAGPSTSAAGTYVGGGGVEWATIRAEAATDLEHLHFWHHSRSGSRRQYQRRASQIIQQQRRTSKTRGTSKTSVHPTTTTHTFLDHVSTGRWEGLPLTSDGVTGLETDVDGQTIGDDIKDEDEEPLTVIGKINKVCFG
jgi:hypothetical protein